MLYSHSIESEKLNIFSLYLSSILEGNNNYKNEVDNVLKETHELATGMKNYYNINRDYFPIIVFFFREAPDFFTQHTFERTDDKVYKGVFDIMQRQRFIGSI
ncbi:MAG: hypothetical protein ACHQNT_05905 [Bacteroidia bacterium]